MATIQHLILGYSEMKILLVWSKYRCANAPGRLIILVLGESDYTYYPKRPRLHHDPMLLPQSRILKPRQAENTKANNYFYDGASEMSDNSVASVSKVNHLPIVHVNWTAI